MENVWYSNSGILEIRKQTIMSENENVWYSGNGLSLLPTTGKSKFKE